MATNKTHSTNYYRTRSIVRILFWGTLASTLAVGFGATLKALESDIPECDVNLNFDFTWNVQDFASLNPNMTLNDCQHPQDVVLSMNGTWDWYNPDL